MEGKGRPGLFWSRCRLTMWRPKWAPQSRPAGRAATRTFPAAVWRARRRRAACDLRSCQRTASEGLTGKNIKNEINESNNEINASIEDSKESKELLRSTKENRRIEAQEHDKINSIYGVGFQIGPSLWRVAKGSFTETNHLEEPDPELLRKKPASTMDLYGVKGVMGTPD